MNYNLWENIIIQERARLALKKIYTQNTYPPAFIFFGQKGIGKEAHALAFAQSINCEKNNFEPCGQCERCKRIYNLLSPDIYLIFPQPSTSSEKDLFLRRIESIREKKK